MDLSTNVNEFRFKKNAGGVGTIIFSNGHQKSCEPGETVDIPAAEKLLLKKLMAPLATWTLIGEAEKTEIAETAAAKTKIEKILNPPLEKPAGARLAKVERSKGWYDVVNADGEKINTTALRESDADELVKAGE